MKYLKKFNENFENNQDIQQEILDIFQPLKDDTYIKVAVYCGVNGKSNHIAIDVVADDTTNGFNDTEKDVLKDVLKQ